MPSSKILSAVIAGALMMGQATAAPQASPAPSQATRQAPLPAGPAAPVREAQGVARPLLYWAGAGALIIAGVLLIAGPQDDDDTATTTTTGN